MAECPLPSLARIKALSLWQPWATLMALGVKTVETRSWSTRYRGDLLICAAKTRHTQDEFWALCNPAIRRALEALPPGSDLPRGVALALVELVDVVPVEQVAADPYGNFQPGRFAWVTRNLRPLPEPVPIVGRQGLFEVDLPAAVVERITRPAGPDGPKTGGVA